MKTEEELISEEFEKVKKNPHKYIMDWMESNLIHVGSRVFRLLAIQPCSLILPDIPFKSTHIRVSLNVLFLAPPSSGKSTIAKKYGQITYNPYIVRKVTSAKLSQDLSNMRLFTLILEDFSQIGNDYEVIKVIEGAIGDEKSIIKKTMRDDISKRTQGVGLMCGTWSDLARYLEYFKGGLLFRFVLLFLDLTKEQHLETGKYISNNIGNKTESNEMEIKQKAIKQYYDELMKIMAGENKDIPQIHGYFFSDVIKDEIYKEWASITSKLAGKLEFYFNRELHEAYRFLVSSALLNVFHRKVENGILYPNEEDLKLAKELMMDNLRNKVSILQSKMYLSSIRSASDLRRVLDADVPERIKRIIINLSPYSNGLKSKF